MADSSFKINKGLTLSPQSTAPTNPTNGDAYFNSVSNTFCLYQDGAWINLNSTIDVVTALNITSADIDTSKVENSIIKLTGSGICNIHGLSASVDSKICVIYNGSSTAVAILNESTTETTPQNRVKTSNGSSIYLDSGKSVSVLYDAAQQRWVAITEPVQIDVNLPMLGSLSGDTLSSTLTNVNAELAKLFEDRNVLLQDGGLITYTGTQVKFTEALKISINSKIAGGSPTVINLGSSDRNVTTNGTMIYAVVNRTTGTATVVDNATSLPTVTSANQEVFLIAKRSDAADGTERIYWRNGTAIDAGDTVRLGASGSGGDGSGIGDDLVTTQFTASLTDEFNEPPGLVSSSIDAGNTSATYNSTKKMYEISAETAFINYMPMIDPYTGLPTPGFYNPSQIPVSGLSNIDPYNYTGSIITIGGEVRTVTNYDPWFQTVWIDTPFSFDVEALYNFTQCSVSKAVTTVDLCNASIDGLSINQVFGSSMFSQIMVDYEDTEASGDNLFDVGPSDIGFIASSDGTNWSNVVKRPDSRSEEIPIVNLPTSGDKLYIKFFNLSAGTRNLLKYKAYLKKVSTDTSGSEIANAIGFTDNSSSPQNCIISTTAGGKTSIKLTWSYPVGVSPTSSFGSLDVYLDGKLIPRFVNSTLTPDAYYKEISPYIIELDRNYSTYNLSVQVLRRAVVVDASTENTSNIAAQSEVIAESIQNIVASSDKLYPRSVAGTYTGINFYSAITNRAPIVDITNDLKAHFGIEKIIIEDVYKIKDEKYVVTDNEYSDLDVWGAVGDKRGLVRFIGNKWETRQSFSTTGGQTVPGPIVVSGMEASNLIEVTFFGTGLNLLTSSFLASTSVVCNVSVDGAAFGATNIYSPGDDVLLSAKYRPMNSMPVVSNLTLGLHTVTLRFTAIVGQSPDFIMAGLYGFEILNTSSLSQIKVNPGSSYVNGKKIVTNSLSSFSYNSDFESGLLGSKGGRVLVYQKSDGTIAKSVTPTDTTAKYVSQTDHTNEEIVRRYGWQEFQAKDPSKDLSGMTSSGAYKTFTLDDNTTTLEAQGFLLNGDIMFLDSGSHILITFVGTGLDVELYSPSGTEIGELIGVSIDAGPYTYIYPLNVGSSYKKNVKICSGLKYGTHTVLLEYMGADPIIATNQTSFSGFTVYQPKTPVLPENCFEICSYNIFGNFVPSSGAATEKAAEGTLRKYATREVTYKNAAWLFSANAGLFGHYVTDSSQSIGASFEHNFFGTGFDLRYYTSTSATTHDVTIDGIPLNTYITANGGTTGVYSTTSTDTLNASGNSRLVTSQPKEAGAYVYGIPLGYHTVKFTRVSGIGDFRVNAFDIITPIHTHQIKTSYDGSTPLFVGHQSINDERIYGAVEDSVIVKSNNELMPTVRRFTSGSGTYIPPTNVKYIRVRMVGGGGAGKNASGNGGNGENTTFGGLIAYGGVGSTGSAGGVGGSAPTIPSSVIRVVSLAGAKGGKGTQNNQDVGGAGGATPFGGAGLTSANNAISNTGSGGGGGESGAFGGGGAGAYIEAIILSPIIPLSYSVGSGGLVGVTGLSSGGSGIIIVEEYYS